ncbi:gephyrin-like molybdotransferase Glp [Cellvibrio sp. pealriver]|uniref:molybdopterin molybdotransferase MoeA n=1 Tax=Cellvibrio sp. pealriver TaxID=1622269 RepID=UPI00066FDC46|nr:gephyrin-like molybdotransferase Glp [Cellvibrio sp. pealriver]
MDHCAQPQLLPIDDALTRLLAQLVPVQEQQSVALLDALDRVLASDVIAPVNVPADDNSAMDGYALRAQDSPGQLQLIGESLAGHPFRKEIKQGQCVRIMTGALIPAGADTVVMQENVLADGDSIVLNESSPLGNNIRRAGEDIAHGSKVLAAGHRITALDIGLLASLGLAQVKVVRNIRVALLTTGDELLPAGAAPELGKIYDSNRPLLRALLQRLPVELTDLGVIPDNPDALRNAFTQAMQTADVVISTGGVSVGDADYTKDILAELGEIDFWKIAMKPGKPFAFGRLGKGWFFGLPGNPVSTAVTYHQLVVPALRKLSGETQEVTTQTQPVRSAIARHALKKQPGRTDFQRGIVEYQNGIYYVRSAGLQNSGVLTGMANANCYIRLEAERGSVAEGEQVEIILFDSFIV